MSKLIYGNVGIVLLFGLLRLGGRGEIKISSIALFFGFLKITNF
tara:strand:- start:191 stop:322 length:132 start_codon:yes stop_codon:yes gene_type:complete